MISVGSRGQLIGMLMAALTVPGTSSASTASPRVLAQDATALWEIDVKTHRFVPVAQLTVLLTDIAATPNGELFGLDNKRLYRIEPDSYRITTIGEHGVPSANALVSDGAGRLLAMGSVSTWLFALSTETGRGREVVDVGHTSSGDLAFYSGHLYLSSSQKKFVDLGADGLWKPRVIGILPVDKVLGLAADEGQLLGFSGAGVFSVDIKTAKLTMLFEGNFQGPILGATK
jgi:hypothetical protein